MRYFSAIFALAICTAVGCGTTLPTTDEAQCIDSGGEWREFSDACADTCEYNRGEADVCAQMLTMSCDCGDGMCWDGNACVAI